MRRLLLLMTVLATAYFTVSGANTVFAADKNIQDLENQIERLQSRIDELEAAQAETQANPYADAFLDAGMPDMFARIQAMQDHMDRLFRHSMGNSGRAPLGFFTSDLLYDEDYEMTETDDAYRIRFDLAGLDEKGLKIEVKNQALTISGVSSNETEKQDDNGYYTSRSYGSFLKTVALPPDADTDNMHTQKRDGKLIIEIPKRQT